MFLLSRLWARILFDSGALHSFIIASCVEELSLEVETLENPLYVNSPLETRVSVQLICRNCELEISRILLTVDLKVMDMSEFDVILVMDWLMAHLLPTHGMESVLCFRGINMVLYPRLCMTPDGTNS